MRNLKYSLLSASLAAGLMISGSVSLSAMASSEEVEVILGYDDFEEGGEEGDNSGSTGTYADEDNGSSQQETSSTPATEPATTPATEPATTPATEPATSSQKSSGSSSYSGSGTSSSTSSSSGTYSWSGSHTSSTKTQSQPETYSDYSADQHFEENYDDTDASEDAEIQFVNFYYDESLFVVTCEGEDVLDSEKSAKATNGTVVFQVTPADGYTVGSVIVNDSFEAASTGSANEYVVEHIETAVTNITISAGSGESAQDPDQVILTVNVNGAAYKDVQQAVTSSLEEKITEGEDYTFSLTPNTDMNFSFVEDSAITYSMDGTDTASLEVSEDGSYTVPDTTAHLHITVNLVNPNTISFFGSMTDYALGEEKGNSAEGLLTAYQPSQSIQLRLTGNGGLGDTTVDQLTLSYLRIMVGGENAQITVPTEEGGAQLNNLENGLVVLVTKDDSENWPGYTVSIYTQDGSDIEGYIDVETRFADVNETAAEESSDGETGAEEYTGDTDGYSADEYTEYTDEYSEETDNE